MATHQGPRTALDLAAATPMDDGGPAGGAALADESALEASISRHPAGKRLSIVPTLTVEAPEPEASRREPSKDVKRTLRLADTELAAASEAHDPYEAFAHAHLAAIRSAAAIVEFRGRPHARSGAKTVWEMLAKVEPELAPWSVYFASGARARAAIDALGYSAEVTPQRSQELIANAEDFRDEVGMRIDPAAGFALRLASSARVPMVRPAEGRHLTVVA